MCASLNDVFIVGVAAFMTCGVVASLTAYAFYTKKDFTMMGSVMWVLLSSLIMTSLLALIFQSRTIHIVYSGISCLVFAIVLIVDTQRIKGGHKFQIGEDDYVIAALMIYVDIVTIFIEILKILSKLEKKEKK